MSLLNGGLPKQANESMEDFVAEFIDHITPAEWRILAQLPPVQHVTGLVAVVCEIRELASWPLPPDHPLNPASRYAETAS